MTEKKLTIATKKCVRYQALERPTNAKSWQISDYRIIHSAKGSTKGAVMEHS